MNFALLNNQLTEEKDLRLTLFSEMQYNGILYLILCKKDIISTNGIFNIFNMKQI